MEGSKGNALGLNKWGNSFGYNPDLEFRGMSGILFSQGRRCL
jgi:hypothetical protein